ncbi:NAD(P)-binding protein [Staphylococcus equorum]|uniref:precorrin-2 dehydrogenase n=1 Tax=Staphylococcus equorum TaxID=246432 RepID=A0A9X4LC07_9STAP|nr:NAD(P)-binding protein [Staphylococcus equorum]MDG0842119.1 NAD(P)-binding protein [Staphylococcus equorum]MDG0857830.1 NAD(P)-binding protein [Staphylococcus equorum]
MSLIPLMIDITNKKVFVIGGGKVAERRVTTLVNYAKDIHIISPTISENLKDMFQRSVIKWSEKSFEVNDIQQADLIVVATNDASTNQYVLQHKPSHAMINMTGAATAGDVVFPSILQRGKLTLSISTNGASPALTAEILAEFQQRFTSHYEAYVDFLYECRQRVKQSALSSLEKQRFLKSILADSYLEKDNQKDVMKWLDSLN